MSRDLINSSAVVRRQSKKLFSGKPFKRLAINLPLYWHLFAGNEMCFGLSLSISGVVLLGFSWAAKLRVGGGMCVSLFCAQICLRLCELGGDWAHYACSSLQSDLLVLIGKDSSNKHRGVVVTQA